MRGRGGAGHLEAVCELVLVGLARAFVNEFGAGVACSAGRSDGCCLGVGDYLGGCAGAAATSGMEEYSKGCWRVRSSREHTGKLHEKVWSSARGGSEAWIGGMNQCSAHCLALCISFGEHLENERQVSHTEAQRYPHHTQAHQECLESGIMN